MANLGLTAGLGRFVVVSPTLLVRGSRPRFALDPRPPVPAYGLVNVNARLRNVFETLELSAVVTNLFDKHYVDPSPFATLPVDYPRPGRSALLGVTYKF
jgi:outer membrane receptor protein involved in Fe transport